VTTDRSTFDDIDTKAVVFHFYELNKNDLPKQRFPDQYYGFFSLESSAYLKETKGSLKEWDGFFNITMTFRRDADIYFSYHKMHAVAEQLRSEEDPREFLRDLMKKKKELVTWFASNCGRTEGSKKRMDLVEKLVGMGLNVDRRGNCFPHAPQVSARKNYLENEMLRFISGYKFYLSFENAHNCKDYITEKLYRNAFMSGAVPILYGASKEDYEAVIPEKSAIFVDDYPDLSKLVDYVKYLDKNDTAYMEYFGWRLEDPQKFYGYDLQSKECELCLKLGDEKLRKGKKFANGRSSLKNPTVLSSLDDFVYKEESEECLV